MAVRANKARERRFLRLIKALEDAHEALAHVMAHEPIDGNDSRAQLKRDIAEYVGYLSHATWWRSETTP